MNTVIFLEPILIVVVVVSTRSMSWDSLADIYSAMFIHGHQLRKMCSWEIRRKHLGAETEPGHCRFICMSYPFPYYVEFLITVNIKVWISTTFTSSHLERILIFGLILHFPICHSLILPSATMRKWAEQWPCAVLGFKASDSLASPTDFISPWCQLRLAVSASFVYSPASEE